MRHLVRIGTLTIPNGTAASNVIASRLAFGAASDMVIYAPGILPETVTLKAIGKDSDTNTANFSSVYVNGADLTIPAGKAVLIPTSSFGAICLTAGGNVAADRVFEVFGQMDV